MSEQFNKIRETALAKIYADFDAKLEETIENFNESDIRDDDIESVRGKYRNAFQNLFTTGFDIVFQKEYLDKISDEEEAQQKQTECNDLNLSVTDEDLQKLDDANSRNAFYRKVYPAKCSLLLERALKVQLESCSKLKTNVHAVESIENTTEASNPELNGDSIVELSQESCSLLADIKENIDRLRRLETAQKILLNNQN